MESNKIILGLDPGTNIMGYGLIQSSKNNIELIQYGVLNLKKQNDHTKKLQLIFESVNELIEEYKPNEISIESPFWKKCAVYAKTRKGPGCGNGSRKD